MTDHTWRRIDADGIQWEVRVVTEPDDTAAAGEREILEFRPLDANRPPRRIAIPRDALDMMDDEELSKLYRSARPIGGDHYGRPGKKMGDITP